MLIALATPHWWHSSPIDWVIYQHDSLWNIQWQHSDQHNIFYYINRIGVIPIM